MAINYDNFYETEYVWPNKTGEYTPTLVEKPKLSNIERTTLKAVFQKLGGVVVENNYSLFLVHILVRVVGESTSSKGGYGYRLIINWQAGNWNIQVQTGRCSSVGGSFFTKPLPESCVDEVNLRLNEKMGDLYHHLPILKTVLVK